MKVLILHTGGTISMSQDPTTSGVGAANPDQLHGLLPELEAVHSVEMHNILDKPSPQMTLSDMYQLALQVQAALLRDDICGVVVTHGTDTLEETAYYLDVTLQSDKPIVLTGAMRSHNELGADGPINLLHAVRVASNPETYKRGTLVVFNDEIHAARWVTKFHTSQPSTFRSPGHGPLGTISKQRVQFFHPTIKPSPTFPLTFPSAQVALIKATAGMDDRLIHCAVQSTDGLVIEAFGQGNLPPQLLRHCKKAIHAGFPIVIVSRCPEGWVEGNYEYMGGGKQLAAQGFHFYPDLSGPKARIQLIAALSAEQ